MKNIDLTNLVFQKLVKNWKDTSITVLIFVLIFLVAIFAFNLNFFVNKNSINLSQFQETRGYMVGQTDKFEKQYIIENYETKIAVPDKSLTFGWDFTPMGISFISDEIFDKYYKPKTAQSIPILMSNGFGLEAMIEKLEDLEKIQKEAEKYNHYASSNIYSQKFAKKYLKSGFQAKFISNFKELDKIFTSNEAKEENIKIIKNFKPNFIDTVNKLQIVGNTNLGIVIGDTEQTEPLQTQPIIARLSDKFKFNLGNLDSSINIYDIGVYDRDASVSRITENLNLLKIPSQSIKNALDDQLNFIYQIIAIASVLLLLIFTLFIAKFWNKLHKNYMSICWTQGIRLGDFVKLQLVYFGSILWVSSLAGYYLCWVLYDFFAEPIMINLAGYLYTASDNWDFVPFGYFAPTIWQLLLFWLTTLAIMVITTTDKFTKQI